MEKKSSRKAFNRWKKAPFPTRKMLRKGLHIEKKVAQRPLNGEKGPPKGEKCSKRPSNSEKSPPYGEKRSKKAPT